MADADTRTLGRTFIFASAFISARVVSMRLARSSSFLRVDQRPSAIDAPARFTTASGPTPAPPNSPVAGFQATAKPSFDPSPAALSGRTSRHTVCPAPASALTSALPTSPDEPVTRIFIFSSRRHWLDSDKKTSSLHATQAARSGQVFEAFKIYLQYEADETPVVLK